MDIALSVLMKILRVQRDWFIARSHTAFMMESMLDFLISFHKLRSSMVHRTWLRLALVLLSAGVISFAEAGEPGGEIRVVTSRPDPLVDVGNDAAARSLESRLARIDNFFAHFNQSSFDSKGRSLGTGSGEILVQRPHKLRWEMNPPRQQLMVSDGVQMWFYDPDLEQVTIRKDMNSISTVPALILAGGEESIAELFNVEVEVNGTQSYYSLQSKASTSEFREIFLQFNDGVVVRLSILDALNQRLEIHFDDVRINQEIDPAMFHFEVPVGVDVLEDF